MKCNYKSYIFIFGILLISLIFCPQKSKAEVRSFEEFSSGDLLITEVEYNPPQSGTDTKYEWVEIYNNSGQDVLLENWKIEDNSAFDIIPTYTLKDAEFLVIAAAKEGFLTNFSHLTKNFVYLGETTGSIGSGLSNSADSVILKDPTNQIIDQISWSNTTPNLLVSDGFSIERIPYNEDFQAQKHPSPGLSPFFLESAENITKNSLDLCWSYDFSDFAKYEIYYIETDAENLLATQIGNSGENCYLISGLSPTTTYQFFIRVSNSEDFSADSNILTAMTDFDRTKNVKIWEIYPHPKTNPNDEFIELYNKGTEIVDLSGWYLDDAEGGSSPYKIPAGTNIASGKFLVFYKSVTGLSLNDTGDEVRLLWPNLEKVESVKYAKAAEGQSLAKDNQNKWQWTLKITPGAKNIIQKPENAPSSDDPIFLPILDARNQKNDTLVSVIGVITAPPNLFSKYYFYIQDGSSGIKIYYSKGIFSSLKKGDKIEVTGEVDISSGEKIIRIRDPGNIVILGSESPPAPIRTKTGLVGNFEGQLVLISGNVIKSSGSTFYLNDGSGQIKIYVNTKLGFKKPKTSKGDWVQIIGIVSRTNSGLRILPRFRDDIIVSSKIKNQKSKSTKSISGSVLGVEKARAAVKGLEIGQDFRIQSGNSLKNFGFGLVIAGAGLLIIFIIILWWKKKYG